jgi:hypothetical protein
MTSMRLIIAAVAAVIVVFGAASVVLAMRLTHRAQAVDVPTWAARVCTSEADYARAIIASIDNVNPDTLDLPTRKQRANRIGKVEIDAARAMANVLKEIQPPEAARAFHDALIKDADEEASATQEQLDAVAKATSAQQIAIANAQVRFRRESSAQNLTSAAQALPADVTNVIDQEPACQQVPIPGGPGGPAPAAPSAGFSRDAVAPGTNRAA